MNATTHDYLLEDVMAFLDGELSSERAAAIAAHLETCSECSAVASNFRALSGQMTAWRVGPVPTTLEETGAMPELERIPKRRRLSRFEWAIASGSAVVAFLLLMAIAVPNLLRSKIAANESSAVGSLRTLNTAAATYRDTYGHYPPSLRSFGPPTSGGPSEQGADLVDPVLAGGRKSGYLFTYHAYPGFRDETYTIQADPLDPESSGVRHFLTDQTGALFANGAKLGDDGDFVVARGAESVNGDLTGHRSLGSQAGAGGKLREKDIHAVGQEPRTGLALSGPMIARTVSLSIVVKDFDAGRASLDAILARHNGYAANLSVSTPRGAARALQGSLRIPASQLRIALGELKSLGRVEAESQNGKEVTQQHADLVARLKNSRETEQRLQDVLRTRTGKVKDVLDVEQEIARVRGETEQMEAEQKALEHRVDFATIDLKLAEEYKAQLNTPAPSVLMQLRNAAVNGFRNAFESFLGLVLFLAESGPSLLLWLALLGIPAWRLWRRYRRAQSLGSLAGA